MSISVSEARSVLIWGAIGGSLPTLGKLAGTYGANFDAPLPNFIGVGIAVGLYALIGSVVSRAVANPDIKQSLFAGIAAPAIVVSVITGASDGRTSSASVNPPAKKDGLSISSAFAQGSPTPGAQAPRDRSRTILLETCTSGSVPINGLITVYATVPGTAGDTPLGKIMIGAPYQRQPIQVPSNATSLIFSSDNVKTELPVRPNDSDRVLLDIYPRTSGSNDLLWGLGGKREFNIGEIGAKYDTFR